MPDENKNVDSEQSPPVDNPVDPVPVEPTTVPDPKSEPEPLPKTVVLEPATSPDTVPEPSPNPLPNPEPFQKPAETTQPPTDVRSEEKFQQPKPSPTPPIAPVPSPEDQPANTPDLTAPALVNALSTLDINSLTDEQLKAAAALWTKKNSTHLSSLGVAKRQEIMQLNLREIVDFLSHNNGSPLPRISRHTNITPGTTSKYLRQLIAQNKIRAEGWGKNRRYYLK